MGSQWNTQTKMSHDKDRRGQILRHSVTFHIQMPFPILVTCPILVKQNVFPLGSIHLLAGAVLALK